MHKCRCWLIKSRNQIIVSLYDPGKSDTIYSSSLWKYCNHHLYFNWGHMSIYEKSATVSIVCILCGSLICGRWAGQQRMIAGHLLVTPAVPGQSARRSWSVALRPWDQTWSAALRPLGENWQTKSGRGDALGTSQSLEHYISLRLTTPCITRLQHRTPPDISPLYVISVTWNASFQNN